MTEEIGVKISDGDWKSLNNRLDAVDKNIKATNTTVTDQGKKIDKQSVPVQNVVQVRISQYSDYDATFAIIPFDDTVPQDTEGKKVMEVAITPKNEKNVLIVEAIASFGMSNAGYVGTIALFKDSGANALCASSNSSAAANLFMSARLQYKMVAGTVSPITFKINIGPNSATPWLYFNGASGARKFGNIPKSYIQVTEVLEAATMDAAT